MLNGQTVPELIYYKFNGFNSTVINYASSPVGNNPAILIGNQTQGGTGQFGRAMVCQGGFPSSNNLKTGWNLNVGKGDWTISLWIGGKIPAFGIDYIFGERSSDFRCFTNGTAGTGLYFRGGGMTDLLIPGPLFNSPKVITFVYDSSASNVYAYVDGVLTVTQAQSGTPNLKGTNSFRVGGWAFSNFTGLIDEFRFYSRALDSNEVQAVWNQMLPFPSADNDAGVSNLVAPRKGCDGSQAVYAEITNYGLNQIDTVQVHWSVNGQIQTPYIHTQLLDTLNGAGKRSDTVFIGNTVFVNGKTDTLKIWTTLPNYAVDTVNDNDTMTFRIGGVPSPVLNLGNDSTICVGTPIMLSAGSGRDKIRWHNGSKKKFFKADTAGKYWVEVKKNGCWSSDTILVDTFDVASVVLSVDPSNNLCYGVPYTFYASPNTVGKVFYQWRVNGLNTGSQTGDSTFTDTLDYGDIVHVLLYTDQCATSTYAVISNGLVMFINPEPQLINGLSEADTVVEQSTKLYAVNQKTGSAYKWSINGGSIVGSSTLSSVQVKWNGPDTSAMISVLETDTSGCSFDNVLPVRVISVVGISEGKISRDFTVYPNPTAGNFTVKLTYPVEGKIEIYNSFGMVVFDRKFTRNSKIDISLDHSLEKGVYLIKLISGDSISTQKLIIN